MPPKPLPGPSRLSGILKNLNGSPKPSLPSLKGLTVTLAVKNDDFGAQHFLKDDIPKIRYANQDLNIHINRVPKSADGSHKPEMKLDFKDGKTQDIDMHLKWSTSIFEELMDSAGGDRWRDIRTRGMLQGRRQPSPK